ncbi:hypothetical protein WA026_007991 [Henosepilachna vigintioctopunctata]|uniref:Aromatic-L-amino-acid decarboxylase n=1 Tax=Henosepilachna vigintioctopunctata TaxID=420089 RepID=A0AAW1TP18_9CUCU
MDTDEFRKFGKIAIDYLANYLDTIRQRTVLPDVEPGYLQKCLPESAPQTGEHWSEIFAELEKFVVPGLTHWHSPSFHAYIPTANSFAGIVGELMMAGIGGITTTWDSNPASVELELKMMDWLVKMLNLPEHFLNTSDGMGGGCIQNSASESTLLALQTAKRRLMDLSKEDTLGQKLVAYTSDQSNSSVEKAALLASIVIRLLPTDTNGCLRGEVLKKSINEDKEKGFVPCCVIATFGTTGICSFDNVEELAEICRSESIWLHIDAAYAGTALVCPEYRYLMRGIDKVDSFNFNPHKWMRVNSDCSALWFKDTTYVEKLTSCEKVGSNPDDIPNIHLWQIPNCRRFRALKLWFVLRIQGVEGLRAHVRKQVGLANYFVELVKSDERFEVCTSNLGVITFRLKGPDGPTKLLLDKIREGRKIFVMPYCHLNKFMIRFVVCSSFTEKPDIDNSWRHIEDLANNIEYSKEEYINPVLRTASMKDEIRRRN